MHVGAGWIAVIALLGAAAVLLITLPAVGKKKGPIPQPDYQEARSFEAGPPRRHKV